MKERETGAEEDNGSIGKQTNGRQEALYGQLSAPMSNFQTCNSF